MRSILPRQVQIRRGTATEHENFIGKIGEITMDTTNKTLCVHDGETVGGIRLAKKDEISEKISDYFEITENKNETISWGRQFTKVDITIATGNAGIAGTYPLGFTDNRVKIGIFNCAVLTTQSGFSSIAISTDVVTTPIRVAGTNNLFRNDGAITIPFINNITISFPDASAGIGNGTMVRFIGYM